VARNTLTKDQTTEASAADRKQRWPSLRTLAVTKARTMLADLINVVIYRGERVVVERRGKAVAALVSVEDLDFLEKLEDRLDLEAARTALAEAEKKGTTSWNKLKADLGL